MKSINILLITLFICNILIAQNKSTYYIQINDSFKYTTQRTNKNGIRIASNISAIDAILNNSNIEEFIRVFPELDSWENRIHYVVCGNENLERELNLPQFKETILSVGKLCEPMLTGDVPNDPIYIQGDMADLDLINASKAWAIAKNYPKVNVAITDTSFDFSHEDLSLTLIGGVNNIGNAVHGTFTAGRFGAINNNGKGIASSGGYNTNLYVSTNWANDLEVLRLAQLGYRVINCSWMNRCSPDPSQEAIYNQIRNTYNTVVIFGAGNGIYNHCSGNKIYPASYESCVSVTSLGHKYERGVFDADGVARNWKDVHDYEIIGGDPKLTYHHNDAVDISAFGYKVYSTLNGGYWESGGTSFAAPQVAGVAAMILAINPTLTANEVVAILKNTADASIYDIPENVPYIGLLGTGRLDAYAAVQAACATTLQPVNFSSQTVITNTEITSCNDIFSQNVTVQNGAKLIFDAAETTIIDKDFEVELGAELEIK